MWIFPRWYPPRGWHFQNTHFCYCSSLCCSSFLSQDCSHCSTTPIFLHTQQPKTMVWENGFLNRREEGQGLQNFVQTKSSNKILIDYIFISTKNTTFCSAFNPKWDFPTWCQICLSQVGSTTWLNHFISLEKRDVQEKLASLERFEKVKYLAPTDLDLVSLAKTSISISMVRHLFWTCLILVFRWGIRLNDLCLPIKTRLGKTRPSKQCGFCNYLLD